MIIVSTGQFDLNLYIGDCGARTLIGNRIKKLRDSAGYSQEEFANLLDISKQQVYRWENGKSEPSGEALTRIAQVFSITSDYLLGLTDEPNAHYAVEDLTPMERRLIIAMRNGSIVESLETFTALSKGENKLNIPHEPAVNS